MASNRDLVRTLVASLQGQSGDRRPLDPEAMNMGINRLRDVNQNSATDDLRLGPPPCRVKVVGDPEIWDSEGRCFHYLGPALLVNLDDRGMVRSLEFVGVKPDDDFISELWHLDVRTNTYKYRDLSQMQGQSSFNETYRIIAGFGAYNPDEPQFRAGDASWPSEADPHAVPPVGFLEKFKPNSHTFFVDCRSGMFARGPPYGVLQSVIENPKRLLKKLFKSCSMAEDEWMLCAADVIKRQRDEEDGWPEPCREMRAMQVAQLVYGLTANVVGAA